MVKKTKSTTKGKYRLSIVWIEVPVENASIDFEAVDPIPVAKRILNSQGFASNEDFVGYIKKFNRTTQRYRVIGELRGIEDFKVFHPVKRRK